MGSRPYLRQLTQLSTPLKVAIVLGSIAAVSWAVTVSLSIFWDIDAEILVWPLSISMLGTVVAAAVELRRNRSKWVRGLGGLMIAGVVAAILFVAMVIWYASLYCGDGGCN
jgi:hypothetical protein